MPYGQGGRLGDTIRPELGRMDFSGVERGGQALGGALANVGANIGDAIKVRTQEKKDLEKQAKQGDAIAKTLQGMGGEMAEYGNNLSVQLSDPNMSLADRAAVASSAGMTMGVALKNMQMQQQRELAEAEMANRLRAASMRSGGGSAKPPTIEEIHIGGKTYQKQWDPVQGQWVEPTLATPTKPALPEDATIVDKGKAFIQDWMGGFSAPSEVGLLPPKEPDIPTSQINAEVKMKAMDQARKAWESGDKNRAVDIFNAYIGKGGLVGGTVSELDMELMYGNEGIPLPNIDDDL